MTKDEIIAAIRKITAASNGKPPGKANFAKLTGVPEHQWSGRYWTKWSDALIEAGFQPNNLATATPMEHILSCYAEICRELGRVPSMAELKLQLRKHPDFPSHNVFVKPFGDKSNLLRQLRQYCLSSLEYRDIIELLPVLPETPPQEMVGERSEEGWVYLIRSGPYHKVGRSNNLERRVKQISIALPDVATLEHSIKTDDPVGIERYWHERFAHFRKNGEWFQLPAAEVRAFKKRRFQ